jgi:hypothetical protein
MTDPRVQVDSFFGISAADSARWTRAYDKGLTIAHLKGFCAHTKGCAFTAQTYEDRIFHGPAKCTCGLHALWTKALDEIEQPASATAVEVTEEQVRAMVLADDMQTGHERCRHMLRAALAAGLGNGRR